MELQPMLNAKPCSPNSSMPRWKLEAGGQEKDWQRRAVGGEDFSQHGEPKGMMYAQGCLSQRGGVQTWGSKARH